MDEQTIKQSLLDLYKRYWDGYIENIRKTTFSAWPFLIWPRQSYSTAPVRIMICGQETQGWGNELDTTDPGLVSPRRIADIYNGFVNNGGYNSPYWNFSKRVAKAFPDARFVHENIVKIGKRKGAGCDESIFRLGLEHFPVVREEINILKPDLILFLTGKDYDERIRAVLGYFTSERIDADRYIKRLTFADPALPPAIKTYHPGFLQRNGWYHDYANAIIGEIKQIIR